MKKVLSIILALIMVLSTIPFAYAAESETSGQCGDNAYWNYDEETKTITVSGTGEMWDVTESKYGFPIPFGNAYANYAEKIVIGEGITKVGNSAFFGFMCVNEITLPDSLKEINQYAFAWNYNLRKINFGECLEIIGYGAFDECMVISEVVLPSSVKRIEHSAFAGCFNLKNIKLNEGLEYLAEDALCNTFSLEEIEIPSTVKEIGDMTEIVFFSSIKNIINKSFTAVIFDEEFFDSEEEFEFPTERSREIVTYTYLTFYSFIAQAYLTPEKPYDDEVDEELRRQTIEAVNEKFGTNYESFDDIENGDFDIVNSFPDYITISCCSDSAQHEQCKEFGIKHLLIDGPDYDCTPTSGQCGDNAYWSFDTATKTLTITGSGEMWDFYNDNQPWIDFTKEIETVIIEPGLTNIGANAFNDCTKLKSVTISSNLECISDDFLVGCYNLKEIKVSESNPNYSDIDGVLFNKDKSELIIYPAKKEGALYTIPAGVKYIAENAFQLCINLKEITVCDDVEEIGENAFGGCMNLERLNLGEGVKKIKKGAFSGLFNLKNDIILNEGLEEIGDYAFSLLKQDELTIPSTVTYIGEDIFDYLDIDKVVNKSKVVSLPLSDFYTSKQSRNMMIDFYKALYQELLKNGYDGSEETQMKALVTAVSYINEKYGTSFISTDDLIYYCKTDGSDKPYYNIVCYEDSVQHEVCIENGFTHSIIDSTCDDACGKHNIYTNDIMEPTCTENGYEGGVVCLDCEKIFEAATVIPATGHTPIKTEGLKPTCTEIGFEDAIVCDVCGELLEDLKLIQATGHTDNNNDGICDTCGDEIDGYEPEPIPETFGERIISFFKGIVNAILELFKRLFG